eukprot:m.107328 g.107328  ORF g.107328 m.107328 type:complete len:1164 (+) comp12688_c0_seq4:29-3520(+)
MSTTSPCLTVNNVEVDLSMLNEAQGEAVSCDSSSLLVMAGPGSGKTRVITMRVAWLITHKKVSPKSIVLVTFTNKAANEMKERVVDLIGSDASHVHVGTFHSIANSFLHKFGDKIGLPCKYTILDPSEGQSLMKELMKKHPPPYDLSASPRTMMSWVSWQKQATNKMKEESTRTNFGKKKQKYVLEVMESYQARLKAASALDFDDLLLLFRKLITEHPSISNFCKHVLIDEFQDTNATQYDIAVRLCGSDDITVVGDPNQSIYSWRMAQADNYIQFKKDFAGCKVISLTQNYRSTPSIVRLCSHVLSTKDNKSSELWTENDEGHPVIIRSFRRSSEEADDIVRKIGSLMLHSGGRLSFKDFAVLVRTNAMSRAIEQSCAVANIPYVVVGGFKFFDRQEVKDCIAYLKLVYNENDNFSLMRVINTPKRGLGKTFITRMQNAAIANNMSFMAAVRRALASRWPEFIINSTQRHILNRFIAMLEEQRSGDDKSPSGILKSIMESCQYEKYLFKIDETNASSRWENVLELIAMAADTRAQTESLELFLEEIALFANNNSIHRDGKEKLEETDHHIHNNITIGTIHSAKGLEWAAVFVPGVEESILPHFRSQTDKQLAEEKRLLYVAMTRAKFFLQLSHCQWRASYDGENVHTISRFLDDTLLSMTQPIYNPADIAAAHTCLDKMLKPQSEEEMQANIQDGENIITRMGEPVNEEERKHQSRPHKTSNPSISFSTNDRRMDHRQMNHGQMSMFTVSDDFSNNITTSSGQNTTPFQTATTYLNNQARAQRMSVSSFITSQKQKEMSQGERAHPTTTTTGTTKTRKKTNPNFNNYYSNYNSSSTSTSVPKKNTCNEYSKMLCDTTGVGGKGFVRASHLRLKPMADKEKEKKEEEEIGMERPKRNTAEAKRKKKKGTNFTMPSTKVKGLKKEEEVVGDASEQVMIQPFTTARTSYQGGWRGGNESNDGDLPHVLSMKDEDANVNTNKETNTQTLNKSKQKDDDVDGGACDFVVIDSKVKEDDAESFSVITISSAPTTPVPSSTGVGVGKKTKSLLRKPLQRQSSNCRKNTSFKPPQQARKQQDQQLQQRQSNTNVFTTPKSIPNHMLEVVEETTPYELIMQRSTSRKEQPSTKKAKRSKAAIKQSQWRQKKEQEEAQGKQKPDIKAFFAAK